MFFKIGWRSFLKTKTVYKFERQKTYFLEMLLYRPPKENIYIYKQEHSLRVRNGAYTLFSISGRTNCVCTVM